MADKKKLTIKYFPASELTLLPGNPRKEKDAAWKEKLSKIIEAHGFRNPLEVWHDGGIWYIVCGNHRFKVGQSLGMTDFPCTIYEGSREMALARNAADNKSNEWTEWDFGLLKGQIADIDLGHLDIEITGFTAEELGGIFDYQAPEEEEDEPEEDQSMQTPLVLPLSAAQFREWKKLKKKIGINDDIDAFIHITEAYAETL